MDLPPMSMTDCGMPNFGRPSESRSASPRAMLSVASVTMNGCGTRPYTKITPFTVPTASPVASIAPMTSGPPWPSWKTSAPTTVARASVLPTDRSMPRVRITSSWPIASTAMTADASRTLPMLPVVMNKGVDRLAAATIAASIKAGPARSAHRRAVRPEARDAPLRPPGPAGTEPGGSIEVSDAAARDSGL